MSTRRAGRRFPSLRLQPAVLAHSIRIALGLIAASGVLSAQANPTGGVVAAGQATISQPAPGSLQIRQTTPRAVIDWQNFSIGASEVVRFQQPSAMSATLNRVVGNESSSLLGTLTANGRVYLVNQNGVFIGRNARLDAAGLVLSTADTRNDNFMAGKLNFDLPGRAGARIVNEGQISVADGGLVALVAPGVENRGVISQVRQLTA